MGLTFVEGTLTGPTGKTRAARFLVDNGASYSLVAEPDWKYLELTPKRSMHFTLADGTKITRQIGECHFALPQGDGHTPVVLGEPGDEPLLGVVTLEILGLVLNPFTRQLQPMRALLA